MNSITRDKEKAILVNIDFRNPRFNEEIEEFIQLAESAALNNRATVTGSRDNPDARFFVGSGKVNEIRDLVAEVCADVVIFNHALSPTQERNLEHEFNCRVIDRVGLILDIFAQRAHSHEGKLQVELAQLQYLSTRLVRGWTHLERQKGGIGLRGPGETQLETDRRLIGNRIKTINQRLLKVTRQRQQGRRLRHRTATPVVSMVGYTNAGKSTLFNRLTGASSTAANKLFATLDTTLRQLEIAPGKGVVLSDTVGFIRHIPHGLIKAFQGTLEEIREAELLLHVIDVNDEQKYSHIEQVNAVIAEIDAAHVPQILVYNKIDRHENQAPRVWKNQQGIPEIWLSARTGAGITELLQLMDQCIAPARNRHTLKLPPTASRTRARLFRSGVVQDEHIDASGNWIMNVLLDALTLRKFCRENGLDVTITDIE